jgi:hypothetical protein
VQGFMRFGGDLTKEAGVDEFRFLNRSCFYNAGYTNQSGMKR